MRLLETIRIAFGALLRPNGWVPGIVLAFAMSAVVSAALGQTEEPDPSTSPRLGAPEILSPMGSPLLVRIPVEATEGAIDAAVSNFALGPRPINAGIPFIENAELSLERQSNKYFLVIRSRLPVNDLAVGLVIRERLLRGVRSREFTILLDPPVLFEAALAARASEAARSAASAAAAKLPSQALVVQPASSTTTAAAPATVARASRPVRPARAVSPSGQVAAVTSGAPSTAALVSAKPSVRQAPSERTPDVADAKVRSKNATPDKPMRLSLSTPTFALQPTANETTRNELRRRQLILDTDSLMSALLERNHKITLLEKQLASLTARVMATERTLNIPAPSLPTAAQASPEAAPSAAAPSTQAATELPPSPAPAPVPAASVDIAEAAPQPVTPAVATPKPSPRTAPRVAVDTSAGFYSEWMIALVGGGLMIVAIATLAIMRRRRRDARVEPNYAADAPEDAHADNAPLNAPKSTMAPEDAEFAEEPVADIPSPHPSAEQIPANAFPEIHFELPEGSNDTKAASSGEAPTAKSKPDAAPGTSPQASTKAAGSNAASASDDIRGRRTRYLQSRYQDIAILMPPLDSPQRMLKQAGRIHDEGAADYAKRLLKYAAYSRPYTEEFWLALLELLYREKFANDYLVNAKWFKEYHPKSANWDEVQRIGYLLDPAAPLFASAASWSHEEPVLGTWLPINLDNSKQEGFRPELKLELTN